MASLPTSSPRFQFAAGSTALLLLGLFTPVVGFGIRSIDILGTDFGWIGLVLVAAAAYLIYSRQYRFLSLVGAILVAYLLYYGFRIENVSADLVSGLSGNPFGALAISAAPHLEWGFYLLLLVGSAMLVSGLLSESADQLPGLQPMFNDNRKAFGIGGAVLALSVLSLLVYSSMTNRARVADASSVRQDASLTGSTNSERPTAAPVNNLLNYVRVQPAEKTFHEADSSQGEFQSNVVLPLEYHNTGNKPIRALKGVLTLTNQFGDRIQGYKIDYEKTLAPGALISEREFFDYNQYENGDVTVKNTPLQQMKFRWEPQSVIFSDGKALSYGD